MLQDLIAGVKGLFLGPHLDERRSTARALCEIPISCQTRQGALLASLRDISRSGSRVLLDKKLSKGTIVLLVPPKGMGGEKAKAVKTKVMWSRKVAAGYQTGVLFQNPGDRGAWTSELLRELGLTSAPPSQRRKFIRVPASLGVTLSVRGKRFDSKLEDLSLGGALVLAPQLQPPNSPATLVIKAYSGIPEVELHGQVQSSKSKPKTGGFSLSIKFDSITGPQKKILVKHLSELMKTKLRG